MPARKERERGGGDKTMRDRVRGVNVREEGRGSERRETEID